MRFSIDNQRLQKDFRTALTDRIHRNKVWSLEHGGEIDRDISEDVIEAGVAANAVNPQITANLWAAWMCGTTLESFSNRVVITCQSNFFKRYAEQELRSLLESVYKRPVFFELRKGLSL